MFKDRSSRDISGEEGCDGENSTNYDKLTNFKLRQQHSFGKPRSQHLI